MENKKPIFREEILQRLSSPDDLNDVLRAVNPSDWAVLLSVLLIMAGFFVWSLVGSVEREIYARAQVTNGVAHFTVKDNILQSGMSVKVGDTDSLMRDVGKNQNGDYIGSAKVPGMTDGIYEAKIMLERIGPIELLFN